MRHRQTMKNWIAALFLTAVATLSAQASETGRHADIEYLSKAMPANHNNLFHTLREEEFEKALDRLNVTYSDLDRDSVRFEVSRILSDLRDGHAFLAGMIPPLGSEFDPLPIDIYLFSDGLYIRSADPAFARLAGARVLAIGPLSAEKAFARAAELVTYDNEMTLKSRTPYYLQSLKVLHHIGATHDPAAVSMTVKKEGITEVVSLGRLQGDPPHFPFGLVEHTNWQDANPLPLDERALWQRHPDRLLWHHFEAASGIFYLQYNNFEDPEASSLETELANIANEMENLEIEKFVLDVRLCRGGETPLVRTLTKWLLANPQVNRRDQFFVIIGRRTFSSGQLLINALDQYSDAIFVGEPSGASPIFYANARPNTQLESKGITILLPIKYWQTTEEDDLRLWHAPDIAEDLSFSDYRSNRDPALEAVRKFSGLPDLTEILKESFKQQSGTEKARAAYRAFITNPQNRYWETEGLLNNLGYEYLVADKPDEAITVFSLNTESHPSSANAFDSLGEAHMAKGNTAKAIEFYEKSLELQPTNDNARHQLEILKSDAN